MRYCLALAVCPLLSGCFGFAYPSATQTPAIAVAEPDVTAFHISESSSFFGSALPSGSTTMEPASSSSGEIAPRSRYHLRYGFVAVPILLAFGNAHHDSVRLYRPGYETMIVGSRPALLSWWRHEPERMMWKKADTLEAREKAIHDLYTAQTYTFGQFPPNTFVAQEYATLAASPLAVGPAHAADRQRLNAFAEAARAGKVRAPLHSFQPSEPLTETTTAPPDHNSGSAMR